MACIKFLEINYDSIFLYDASYYLLTTKLYLLILTNNTGELEREVLLPV